MIYMSCIKIYYFPLSVFTAATTSLQTLRKKTRAFLRRLSPPEQVHVINVQILTPQEKKLIKNIFIFISSTEDFLI